AKTFKGSLDEAKKQNLILDYKIMIGEAATPQDFNILLMVESPNMAALDNAREKFDPIARKITGSPAAQLATAPKRLDIREIMAANLTRETTVKKPQPPRPPAIHPPARFFFFRVWSGYVAQPVEPLPGRDNYSSSS